MNAYIDASVILREVLHQLPLLREWNDLVVGVTSQLARVECFRTLDQLRVRRAITAQTLTDISQRLHTVFSRLDVLSVDPNVLDRATQPLPTMLATLDAIHLSTAQIYRERQPADEPPIYFATFDVALATAARETGFRVLGA